LPDGDGVWHTSGLVITSDGTLPDIVGFFTVSLSLVAMHPMKLLSIGGFAEFFDVEVEIFEAGGGLQEGEGPTTEACAFFAREEGLVFFAAFKSTDLAVLFFCFGGDASLVPLRACALALAWAAI
jgi:hypothetical protein